MNRIEQPSKSSVNHGQRILHLPCRLREIAAHIEATRSRSKRRYRLLMDESTSNDHADVSRSRPVASSRRGKFQQSFAYSRKGPPANVGRFKRVAIEGLAAANPAGCQTGA